MRFPISTSYEDDQPRLILTAVDVAEGIPVTFDSAILRKMVTDIPDMEVISVMMVRI